MVVVFGRVVREGIFFLPVFFDRCEAVGAVVFASSNFAAVVAVEGDFQRPAVTNRVEVTADVEGGLQVFGIGKVFFGTRFAFPKVVAEFFYGGIAKFVVAAGGGYGAAGDALTVVVQDVEGFFQPAALDESASANRAPLAGANLLP